MKEFEMTDTQLALILEACKPVPVLLLSGGQQLGNSVQENANRAWEKLGKEMGFKHMTVRPSGKGDKIFLAEPTADSDNQLTK